MKTRLIKQTNKVKLIEIIYTVVATVKVTTDKNMGEEVFEVIEGRRPEPTTEDIRKAIQQY